MAALVPQNVLIPAQGGFAIPIQYQDAGGNPMNLAAAGLTPRAELYQANLQRTTMLEVDVANPASGLALAIVPPDVALSLLALPQLGQAIAAAASPYPVRIHAYVLDSRGLASVHQVGVVNPIDFRSADPSLYGPLVPLVATVGPAGAGGQPGQTGPAGADGNSGVQHATAAGPIAAFQVIYADPAGALPASSDQAAEAGFVLGVATAAAQTGQDVPYTSAGALSNPNWNWRVGPIWLGLNGALTQVPPTSGLAQQIATATSPSNVTVRLGRPSIFL